MGRLMRAELERFEREKVEDFKSGVETFLEGAVEAQKELIELWETYLLQLDSEEDGPPLMPAGVQAAEEQKSEARLRREAAKAQLDAEAAEDSQILGSDAGAGEDAQPRLSGTTVRDDETERVSEDTLHDEAEAGGRHTAEVES